MSSNIQNEEKAPVDYKVNVQMVTFIVIVMVVILSLVYFIRIYSAKKETVLQEMKIESILLETVILDNLNYAKYFISLIGRKIKQDPYNLSYIKDTLQNNFHSQEFNMLFGWRKYSWVDNNFKERVTSTKGIEQNPKTIDFIKEIINEQNDNKKNNIAFRVNKYADKADSLKLVENLFDSKTNNFIGSVVLSYDIDTVTRSLNNLKKSPNINFVIIDKGLNIIAKSKPEIDKLIKKDNVLSPNLLKLLLNKLNFNHEQNQQDFSYLDMINGVNYYVKPLQGLPFAVIVNIDNNVIKRNIVENITAKLLEVGFFATICLIVIISIYKRETSLRTRAEKATILANDATKAKTNFLAFTAHEIRSPLGFILTGSEMMSKEIFGPLPANYLQYAEGIHSNAQVILDFITDILDEDQIIEGNFKIVNSLNKIEDLVMMIVKPHARKKNISISTDFASNLPLVICDKRRILQVIDNLVNNSIKYSKKVADITISVELEDETMIITVTDNGIGMKESEIPEAISKYGTLHKKDYQKGGSYGLGLPIVKMLLDAHDATLEIHSIDGEGTSVKITFPKYKLVYNSSRMNER